MVVCFTANEPLHKSFQNEVLTKEGLRLFDLDKGLLDFKKDNIETKAKVYGRDQWLYVYNYKHNTTSTGWRGKVADWYKENEGKALSENPEILLKFYQDGIITLPPSVVKELEISKKYDILLGSAGSIEQYIEFGSLKKEGLDRIKEQKEILDPKSFYEMIEKESQKVDDLIGVEANRYSQLITSLQEAFPEKPPKNLFLKWLDRIFGAQESSELSSESVAQKTPKPAISSEVIPTVKSTGNITPNPDLKTPEEPPRWKLASAAASNRVPKESNPTEQKPSELIKSFKEKLGGYRVKEPAETPEKAPSSKI